ncbi:MAG: ABC transporter substrate-binding protein [Anaerolineae bacterium]
MFESKLTRREMLRAAMLGSAAMVVAACAPKTETETETEAGTGGEVKQAEPAAGEEVEVTLWWHEYGEQGTQAASERIAKEYTEATPGVKVTSVWNPGDYTPKLYAAFAGGVGPDAYESDVTVDKVVNKYAVALDDLYEGVRDDFLPADLARVTIKGHLYGIPEMVDFQILCYRNSLLEASGVSIPETWEEVFEAAKTLTKDRVKGIYLGNDAGVGRYQFYTWSTGTNFMTEEDEEPEVRFNTEGAAAAWAAIRDLNESGAVLLGAPTDYWDPAAFNQGLCAIQHIGFWSVPAIIQAVGDDYTLRAWPPMPVGGEPGRTVTNRGGWIAMVNGQSKVIKEAMDLQKWMWIDNLAWQEEWNTGYGYKVPPRKSLVGSIAKLSTGEPKKAADAVQAYGLFVGTMWIPAMGTAVTDEVTAVIKSGKDPAQAVDDAYVKAKGEFDSLVESAAGI